MIGGTAAGQLREWRAPRSSRPAAFQRKIYHHDGVLLDDADSITMPIMAMTDSSKLNAISVRIAPMPAEGSRK